MNEDKDKKIYELALLLKNEEDLSGVVTLLKQHSAEVTSEPRAKKMAFAYKIKSHTEGVFVSLLFTAFPSDAKELEHDLITRQDVIRFMILASPPPPERAEGAPSFPSMKRGRPSPMRMPSPADAKPAAPRTSGPLSNEAIGKKIEEILQ